MIAGAALVLQSDATVVQQLDSLVTTQIIIAISLAIVALAVLGVAVGALLAVRKLMSVVDDAKHAVTDPMNNLLGTVEDVNARLRTAVDAVEVRVKRFGAVVDVVQTEAEQLMVDATSTVRGVHAASQALRSGRHEPLPGPADDEFTDEEIDDGR